MNNHESVGSEKSGIPMVLMFICNLSECSMSSVQTPTRQLFHDLYRGCR